MRSFRLLVLALGVLAAAPVHAQSVESAEPSAIQAALADIRDGDTIGITTVGRKTQRVHSRPVWYVVDGATIVVQSGRNGKTDWYRNALKTPNVTLRAGRYAFRGSAKPITDPAEVERIHAAFLAKYRTAWALSFFGSQLGRGLPLAITPETVIGAAPAAAP
jgi:deazaflavin-dependent oxidoreductase (nitroreductase family)